MYFYIYDSFLNNNKYSSVLNRIEAVLTDLGINGRIERTNLLKNIKGTVERNITSKVKTLVVVGNDKTFSQVIASLSNFNVTLGYIPIGTDNKLAKILGIPPEEEACYVLSSRIIKTLDLGKIANKEYFLTGATITGKTQISLDDKYSITSDNAQCARIENLVTNGHYSDPCDKMLDIIIRPKSEKIFGNKQNVSILQAKNITIQHLGENSLPIFIDSGSIFKTPTTISISNETLNIITGKNRMF